MHTVFIHDSTSYELHFVQTSGLMVFARDCDSASGLCKAWRERDRVHKTYLARVTDWPPLGEHGEINLALSPSDERLKWKVDPKGKRSQTLWKITNRQAESTILALTPVTGRTHQLRIHCAEIGSGIEGDSLYGLNPVELADPTNPGGVSLCLHAHKLSLPHPTTGEQLEFTSFPGWLPE
jgi:tRNA pseudouridine32 synthase / 23S rRNA pseudouridine746 synthase